MIFFRSGCFPQGAESGTVGKMGRTFFFAATCGLWLAAAPFPAGAQPSATLLPVSATVPASAPSAPNPTPATVPAATTPVTSPAPAAPTPATPSSADENRALKDLQTLFDEGLFEKTDAGAKAFLQRFPASPLKSDVRFLQGKALYFLGEYAPALAAFNVPAKELPDPLAASFLFWQGETESGLEKWTEAEKAYRDALSQAGDSPLAPQAQLGLAWALFKEGNETDARALLGSLMQASPPTEAGEKAALVLAKIEIADNQLDGPNGASATLEALLARKVHPAALFEANYWRGEIAQLRGQYADAVTDYRIVTDDPKAFPGPLVAEAWFGLGSAYQKLNQHDKAMQALEQAFTLGSAEQMRLASFRLYLESAQAQQRLPEAQAKLRDFAKGDHSPVTASAALFAIATSQAANNAGDEAIGTLEALLTAYPQTIWRPAALFQLGQLYVDKGAPDSALTAFQNCLDAGAIPTMASEAEFKSGEIWFARGDFAKASDFFQKAAGDENAPSPIAEKALFNLLLSEAQAKNLDGYLRTEADFERLFPKSAFLGRVKLELAKLYEKTGQEENARTTYEAALQGTLDPEQHSLLLVRLADLDRDANPPHLDDALKLYNEIIDLPNDPRAPEAAYDAVMVSYQAKKLTPQQARDGLLELAGRFDKSAIAPNMLFSAAEFFYHQQDYVGAQTNFEKVANSYPQSELVPEALYYAGDSAVKRKDYAAAIQILEKIPESAPLKVDARLLQGLIYHLQGKFDNAVALFDAVLATQKDGPLFVTAILRKGNALYALGGADPTKYELAASNYGLLLSSNQGDFAQRNEAAYMRAMCFEKLGRTDDALALYLDVLNGRTLPPEAGNAPLPPEFHWRVLAGNSAAEIRKQQQDWPGAIDVYRRLESLGGPQQNEFHDDIIRLRREHFLFDDAEVPTATVAPVAPANAPVPTPAPATAPAAAPAPSLAPAPAKAGP